MTMRSWARNLFARPVTRPIRKAPPRTRLCLEALEDRTVPSTFTVVNALDDGSVGSLRWAVGQANSTAGADTVVFSGLFNTPQTITLTGGQLTLTDAATTTINGPGANLLSISGNNASRVFFVNGSGASAALSGLTITGGKDTIGGGLFNNGGTLTMSNCTVRDNSTTGQGGGGVSSTGTLTMSNCTISG